MRRKKKKKKERKKKEKKTEKNLKTLSRLLELFFFWNKFHGNTSLTRNFEKNEGDADDLHATADH